MAEDREDERRRGDLATDPNYPALLEEIREQIRAARLRVTMAVNAESDPASEHLQADLRPSVDEGDMDLVELIGPDRQSP
jgi:hypothetical protein